MKARLLLKSFALFLPIVVGFHALACDCVSRDWIEVSKSSKQILRIRVEPTETRLRKLAVIEKFKGVLPDGIITADDSMESDCSRYLSRDDEFIWMTTLSDEKKPKPVKLEECDTLIPTNQSDAIIKWLSLSEAKRDELEHDPNNYCINRFGKNSEIELRSLKQKTAPDYFQCSLKVKKDVVCPYGMSRFRIMDNCKSKDEPVSLICGAKLLKRWPALQKPNCRI